MAKKKVEHEHVLRVAKWGVKPVTAEFYIEVYGCTECDWTQYNTI